MSMVEINRKQTTTNEQRDKEETRTLGLPGLPFRSADREERLAGFQTKNITMSDELLTRENKFYELNGELERKTRELMREVNSVVSTTRLFDGEAAYERLVNNSKSKNGERDKSLKQVVDSVSRDSESDAGLPRFLSRSKKIKDTPDNGSYEESFEKRNDAVVRFFKSKAKILESELEAIKLEYKKKCDYSSELQAENKKLDEERVKFCGQVTSLRENLGKIEATNSTQLANLQKSENENVSLKKELDALKKELKATSQSLSSYTIRLNRSTEENERLSKALKSSRLKEKELREDNRKLEEEKKAAIVNLEKQRSELLHAFKKQMLLVDNLKKQKAHLEANILIKYTEEELLKLLDWKLDDV
ncbi:testis-expressed protein 9 isoform X1 [Neodiprion pinetum]|uniref:testis-expressed protein 9 isoform X1 n=2 Tax=Neodiprion pinetum TaxID=441929 RepID=UPI001EDF529E|nr:testis-expressed protein 9 isoform X1 [Neodiprion pinetum]